jgi:hypothetical protein
LIKQDTGFQVTEKHHGIEPFYIDAGRQQIHGASDKSTFAGTRASVRSFRARR